MNWHFRMQIDSVVLLSTLLWVSGVQAAVPREDALCDVQYRFLFHQQGWGELGINTCAHAHDIAGMPLQINGKTYDKGLGHHAPGELLIDLAGEYEKFEAVVGLQTQTAGAGSVVFKVFVDDQERFDSGVMKQNSPAKQVSVDLAGAQELRLQVTDAGDGLACDCADWADARLIRAEHPAPVKESDSLDIAPFAQVVTSDPARMDGARSNRIQEYRTEDVYLETPLPPDANGAYAVAAADGKPACIGLKWMEKRRLRSVGIQFVDGAVPAGMDKVQAQCWVGESAWQGGWKPISGEWQQGNTTWSLRLNWADVLDARGGTRKIRFLFPQSVAVRRFVANAPTPSARTEIQVQFEKPLGGDASVELYNGYFVGETPSLRQTLQDGPPATYQVRYSKPRPWQSDTTVLRFRLPSGAFGVSMDDVLKNGCVYVRDFGLFVTSDPKTLSLEQYKQKIAGRQTILQQVRTMPDQTFAQAIEHVHKPIQDHSPMLVSLACNNHKLIVYREGRIEFSAAPETDDKHVSDMLNTAAMMTPRLGSGKNEKLTRKLDSGWMPIPIDNVEENGVVYRQRTFAAPLNKEATAEVGVAEFTIENTSNAAAHAEIHLAFAANSAKEDVAEFLPVPTGAVAFRRGRLLAYVRASEAAPLKLDVQPDGMAFAGEVGPRITCRVIVFIPTTVMKPEQHTEFGSPDDLLRATRDYWTAQLAPAMQVDLPDPLLNNIIKASQVHCLIAARNEADGQRVAPWIASILYGPLESESNSIIRGMDFFGHHDFARKSLEFFIHRYSPSGMMTTGYTLMGVGWHTWMLGEHYALTRDRDWLGKVAGDVTRICKWMVAQREKTMQTAPDGTKPPEYGLIPPGVMADWNAFAYYFCDNGYYCAGLRAAAEALADVGVSDAAAWKDVAAQYRESILRAYAWTRAMMPVYPLRDGTSVPGYPSQLHGPGPTANFFPGEDGNRSWCYDIELGSHHLVPLGILDPQSRETAWMMDHMEDVQFVSEGWFDYPAEQSQKDWYNLGGFAKVQPYYCRNAEVCAMRDDVKPFIRTYFNTIPSLLCLESLSFQEHFAGVGAWNKTHETGYFLHQSRTMLVMERGDDLWLAPFVTNNWLKEGMAVAVSNAPTRFGPVSYRINSSVAQGNIDATIDPPVRAAPRQIVLRLRHPEGKPMQKVTVNGQPHADFDPAKEIIRISPAGQKITVRASY